MANLPAAAVPLTTPITRKTLQKPTREALHAAVAALEAADALLAAAGHEASNNVRFAVRCALGNAAQAAELHDS